MKEIDFAALGTTRDEVICSVARTACTIASELYAVVPTPTWLCS